MCLNSGGNNNGQFFIKIFLEERNDKEEKMTEGITVINFSVSNT